MKVKNKYIIQEIFSYLEKKKAYEIIKYNIRTQKDMNINLFDYKKYFIEKHFHTNLSIYKFKNLLNFFKKEFNLFTYEKDIKILKKICERIPYMKKYKMEDPIIKNDNNYLKCNLKEMKNFNQLIQPNLYTLQILDLDLDLFDFSDSYSDSDSELDRKTLFLKDEIPNLIKLRIDGNNDIYLKVPYELLNKLQYLLLIDIDVEIIVEEKGTIELENLKNLLIIRVNYKNKQKIFCPKLEYLLLNKEFSGFNSLGLNKKIFNDDIYLEGINKINEFNLNENLEQIIQIYKNMTFCKFSFKSEYKKIKKKNFFGLTFIKYNKNLIKYEIKKAECFYYKKYYEEYYYQKSWLSNNNNNINKNELDDYEEIYLSLGNNNPKINIFKEIGINNYSINYINVITHENNIDKNKIKNLINNIIYFKMLKSFSLVISDNIEYTVDDLINTIKNLSQLYLIEYIKIEIHQKLNLENSDKILFFRYFPKIKIEETKRTIILYLKELSYYSFNDYKFKIDSKFSDRDIRYSI